MHRVVAWRLHPQTRFSGHSQMRRALLLPMWAPWVMGLAVMAGAFLV
jgi:hypothetical protein